MADSASESDSSSIDGGVMGGNNNSNNPLLPGSSNNNNNGFMMMMPPSPVSREQLHKRVESLTQQNRVLKVELDTWKLRVKALQEENKTLRQASVNIQAKAEQEEEFISNTLLKKIQALKKEKESLCDHFEKEEECLTNDLSRKLNQLKSEKCKLEQTLEMEQESLVNKLMRKIEKLESETLAKQNNLDQLRREKVELENTLEQEQESLVNRLWKKLDNLEAEKRLLQNKVESTLLGMDPTTPSPINFALGSNRGPNHPVRASLEGERIVGLNFRKHSRDRDDLVLPTLQLHSGHQHHHHHHHQSPQSISGSGSVGNTGDSNISMSRPDKERSVSGNYDADPDNDGKLNSMNKNLISSESSDSFSSADASNMSMENQSYVQHLRNEIDRLKNQLAFAQQQHTDKMTNYTIEERSIRDENLRLQRRLQLEMERRIALCRHLSESESSLELEEERQFNDSVTFQQGLTTINTGVPVMRPRPGSSPGLTGRPMSPMSMSGGYPLSNPARDRDRDLYMMSPPSPTPTSTKRCHFCNGAGYQNYPSPNSSSGHLLVTTTTTSTFARPANPVSDRSHTPDVSSNMSSPAPPSPLTDMGMMMSPRSAPSPSPMDTSNKN